MKSEIGITRVLNLFRYCSFLVTSIYFLISGEPHSNIRKAFIIGCIAVSAFMLNYLYIHYLSDKRIIVFLIALETILNAIILIPSGGLDSPYIWYSINTIIIAFVTLKDKKYGWLSLLVYVFSSTWLFIRLLNPSDKFLTIISKELNLILSLTLFTGAIHILSVYYQKVQDKNKRLNEVNSNLKTANNKIKESMDYIMELYQAVHLLSNQQDSESLINIILEYTKKITKSNIVFFINNDSNNFRINILGLPERVVDTRRILQQSLNEICAINEPQKLLVEDESFVLAPVKSCCDKYGILGIILDNDEPKATVVELIDQLKFLSELGEIALERIELERINKGLLINAEQNRIADEIHDGVLQQLFGISCGIFGLKKKINSINISKMEAELTSIQKSINSVMKDLRTVIYGYSWKKAGRNNFIQDINRYLDFIRKNHGTSIDFELTGNQELLSTSQKIAFYRIVSEGVGNSIKHGKAKHIFLKISIENDHASIEIKDNGTGFDTNILKQPEKMGMGIRNMQSLAIILKGSMSLESNTDMGTTLEIKVPIGHKTFKEDLYEGVGS